MLTSMLLLAAQNLEPLALSLGWKKGQVLKYSISAKTFFGDSDGTLVLTVSAADEKSVSVTWPTVDMSGNMRDIPAGSQKLSRFGYLLGTEGQASMYMIPMCLPEKPVAPGGNYVVKYAAGDGTFEVKGTFTKLDTVKGRIAHLATEGTFKSASSEAPMKTSANFDVDRGLFLSGQLEVQPGPNRFFFKLIDGATS